MNNIQKAIKEYLIDVGVAESRIDLFMETRKFTISFGEQDVVEKGDNPKWVKKNGMSLRWEDK